MAACKPPMESNFAFFNFKSYGLTLFLFLNNSSPKEFRGEKNLLELRSISLTLLPIKQTLKLLLHLMGTCQYL